VVAGKTENIIDTQGGNAQYIHLKGNAVSIATCHLHRGFQPLFLSQKASRPARHTSYCGLSVSDVDGVNASLQILCFLPDYLSVGAGWGAELSGNSEVTAFHYLFKLALRFHGISSILA
jgi:hypothetical protein